MLKQKIVILGAGLTGLSTAYHLKKHNIDSLIFEKEDKPGGLCRSKYIDGFIFDYSGHLLHFKNRYTLNLTKDLLNGNLIKHRRKASIYYSGRLIPYPFQANLWALPFHILSDCVAGFLKVDPLNLKKNNISFLNWVYKTFGRGISHYFMLPYNRKFWCYPLEKMGCDWIVTSPC